MSKRWGSFEEMKLADEMKRSLELSLDEEKIALLLPITVSSNFLATLGVLRNREDFISLPRYLCQLRHMLTWLGLGNSSRNRSRILNIKHIPRFLISRQDRPKITAVEILSELPQTGWYGEYI